MAKVKFIRCTAAEYAAVSSGGRIDNDAIYFETTNHRIYLGGECYSSGSASPVQQETS